MWTRQLLNVIRSRYQRAKWLKHQRAMRLDLAHLSDHLKKDIGLNNRGAVPLLTWLDAPETTRTAPTREHPHPINLPRTNSY